MNLYEHYILPELIQLVCSNKHFHEKRQSIIPLATGRVLEIGMGSGINLPFYNDRQVEHILALEPSDRLRKKALQQCAHINIPVELCANGAEDIPLEQHSIDTIVTTFTLCSIAEIEKALKEMRRVLKPEGTLLFCEHGLAPENNIQKWQNRINPWWKRVAGGCHLNRDIHTLIQQSGFSMDETDHQYMQGPKTFSYIYKGIARPR